MKNYEPWPRRKGDCDFIKRLFNHKLKHSLFDHRLTSDTTSVLSLHSFWSIFSSFHPSSPF